MSRFVAAVVAVVLLFPVASHADVVTEWNGAALQAIRTSRTSPPVASRALAVLHIAIYDAVNGIRRTHEPYLAESSVPSSASMEAAASSAARKVLTELFPALSDDFDELHSSILAAIPEHPQKRFGVEWGESVADQILFSRIDDGATAIVPLPGGSGPGVWQPTPPLNLQYLLPQWGFVAPFAMISAAAHRPLPPPSLNTADWAAEYNEVKTLGAASGSSRTSEQSEIAHFWADGAGTETPPGHWNHIAADVAAARGNTLEENARLFALINIAMADAAICAWDAKYAYNFWRPVTAIRNGGSDGNDATDPDPNWSSFIATPPFPDYVSGHSAFSGAASRVLALFYGTDDVAFTTGSDFLPGVLRSFPSFSAAADEAGVSRIYGGIHFRSASAVGLSAGRSIGDYVFERFLTPKGNRSRK
jgi:succinate dehydrogenase hydrophobic anchor subunit